MDQSTPDTTQNGGGADEAPAVVLPSPNAEPVAGGSYGVASSVGPILPQPLLSTGDNADGLASRVEQAIADDGRFDSFAGGLLITTDGGTVRLSGPVPSEGQRRSLLTMAHGIPGVSDVQDDLRVD